MPVISAPSASFTPIKMPRQQPVFSAQPGNLAQNTAVPVSTRTSKQSTVKFGSMESWMVLAGLGGLIGLNIVGNTVFDKLTAPARQRKEKQNDAFWRNFTECETPDRQRELLERYFFTLDDPESKLCALRCIHTYFMLNGEERPGFTPLVPSVNNYLNDAVERLKYDPNRKVAAAAKRLFKDRKNLDRPYNGPSCF